MLLQIHATDGAHLNQQLLLVQMLEAQAPLGRMRNSEERDLHRQWLVERTGKDGVRMVS
jgi:hypothetical protein